MTENSAWTQGIINHLSYLANTPQGYFTGQYQSLHTENPASPYYTAAGALEAGRSDLTEGAVGSSPKQLIDGWLAAPFHAIGMLRQGLQQVAFADDPMTGDAGVDVLGGLDASQSPPSSPVLFPGDGSPTDLWAYSGDEAPSPLETCGWQSLSTVGLPIIALLPSTPDPSLSATLVAPDGNIASTATGSLCVVDSQTYLSTDPIYGPTGLAILQADNAVLLIPKSPLGYGSYTATINQPGQQPVSWSFQDTQPEVLQLSTGNGQTTFINHAFTQALSVTTANAAGFMQSGVPVHFSVSSGSAVFESGASSVDVSSDSVGVATAPRLLAGSVPGPVDIVASTAGASSTTFAVTVNLPRPVCSQTLPSGSVVGMAETSDGGGYWVADRYGSIAACGDAPSFGYGPFNANDPITGISSAPSGDGYWLATSSGAVYSFGSAMYHGGIPRTLTLAAPIVGIAPDPATGGYWLLGADGGVFSFDAPFYGSTGNIRLNRPAVGMMASPSGHGYYFVASDGGIFTFGDARFNGSTGNVRLNQPVVGMALDPATAGYWLDAADGGIFSFHAPFYGSTGSIRLTRPCVGMLAIPGGGGYRFVASDGGIFDFGTAGFEGSAAQ